MAKITLKAARVAAGLTQDEIAEKLGISRSWVNRIENGTDEVKPVYLYAWCHVTGFSENDIILPEEYA